MPVAKHKEIIELFKKCWPYDYARDPSDAMCKESGEHMVAMMNVIDAFWPSTTQLKFVNLKVISSKKSEFHSKRFEILLNYLKALWKLIVGSKPPFESIDERLRKYLLNRVSY